MRIILTDERLRHHIEIIHGDYDDNDFEMRLMDQTSKVFSLSLKIRNNWKHDIKSDVRKFHKMLTTMTEQSE